MNLFELMKELAENGIDTTVTTHYKTKEVYVDLNTRTKSDLHLYENGMLRGRYDYERQMDLTHNVSNLIVELCKEFNDAMHGRKFGNEYWIQLCKANDVELEMYI
ncbi:MAG: hypothetical protein ACI9J3_003294 [Parvicellaceae bacterium]|jgi:hypothetical protein